MDEIEVVIIPATVFEACVRVLDAARCLVLPENDEVEETEEDVTERFNDLELAVSFADKVIDRTTLTDLLESRAEEIDALDLEKP